MKKSQLRLRQKPSSKLAVLALLVLVGFLLLGKGVSLLSTLSKSFSEDKLVRKEYSWDGRSSINLATVQNNSTSILNYDPKNKKITILKIPSDTYFDLPGDRGQWRVGAIYSLGQESSPPSGGELLKQSLAKLVGLPIDGYLVTASDTPLDEEISQWRRNPLAILGFTKKIKTDLSPLEVLRIFRSLSAVRSDKLTYLDLGQSSLTDSQLLPDSTRVLGVNSIFLDLFVRKNMADQTLESEGISIGIFNATSHPGLAQQAQRIITNEGGNVIFTTNSDNLLATSQVVTNSPSETGSRLKQIFAPNCLKNKCISPDPKVVVSRADINVVLGEDFFKRQ